MAVVGVTDEGKLTLGQKTLSEHGKVLLKRTETQVSQVRIVDFLLFAALIYGVPVPGLGLPFNQLMVFIIVGYGLTRKSIFSLGRYSTFFVALGIILAYIAIVSAVSDPSLYAADATRRFIRLVATTGLIYVIAVGRIHLRSAILGYSTALLINAGLFFAGIAPDTYGGYLTGYLGDKNYAGLVHALFALLIMTVYTKRWQQIVGLAVSCFLLWETGSRTSLAALLFAYLWILVAPRFSPAVKVLLLGVFWFLLNLVTEDYADAKVFGDRTGTDALRARIDDMSWAKVQETGWFGQGLGEAYVYDSSADRTWFFHNSYWSAFVEGGWIWALVLVALTLFVAVRPLSKQRKEEPLYRVLAQGVGVALLICALRLGEVFYTLPWAICMGYVLRAAVTLLPANSKIAFFGYDEEVRSLRK
ncbi:O-antigen ligase family protein [Rothia sp. CCM 9417]|uniref:O-antigen ligase family protein n=1 Tax=Rothia sp. CCM 9417 TaxID=3402657 RepID=UPI003ADBB5B8